MKWLHFEITVSRNIVPKIIAGSCFGAKTVKMADKPQKKGKEMLKRLVKKRKGKFQKLGEY